MTGLLSEMDEKLNGILDELEAVNGKLDRLLAVGSARQTECKHQWDAIEPIECIICGIHKPKTEKEASGGEKRTLETGQKPIDGDKVAKTHFDSKLPEPNCRAMTEEQFLKEEAEKEIKAMDRMIAMDTATDEAPIVWIKHDGKKFKVCKWKCGNYVSWDNTSKKYLHYDAAFKLIGHECPKYATSGAFD